MGHGLAEGDADFYNAGGFILNQRAEITGIVVPASGIHTITLTMATKNALASNYYADLVAATMVRTA